MERLVIYLLKLLLQLAFVVLKFALRVALFVWSGDWNKLDKLVAQFREFMQQARQEARPAAATVKRPKRERRPRPAEGPWPFEFAPELTDAEPEGELVGGEAAIQPRTRRRPLPSRRQPPPRDLPLAQAIRQPRLQRDAMILTAVLGPRIRRGSHF